jgi:hypothetical protein
LSDDDPLRASALKQHAKHASIVQLPSNGVINMTYSKLTRNLCLSLLIAVGAMALPVSAQITVNVSIAPPAPQYEVVPPLQAGQVWAPGYWTWTGERHVWVRGRPILQRVGYRWEPDRWEQRGGTYYRRVGNWERDHDYKPAKVKKAKKQKKHKGHGKHD